MKPQQYRDDRPPEFFAKFHATARANRQGGIVYFLARCLATPTLLATYRVRAEGRENVPKSGPVILAPNHLSQLDHFFCGLYLRRNIRYMAKSQLFGPRVLTGILHYGGAFPVRRGHRDEEAIKTAKDVLGHDNVLLIYAEGGRSRSGELGSPRPGVGRIALETGATVIPVAIHGSAGVRRWYKLRFPKVRIRYGEPIAFPIEPDAGPEEWSGAAQEIFNRVRGMYREFDRQSEGERVEAAE